jgi:transcriptional regulator with XRE-family HTH domain
MFSIEKVTRGGECVNDVSEHLREWRFRNVLNQTDLTELSGVGQDTISVLELGKHKPHIKTLRKLAAPHEITLSELVDGPKPEEEDTEVRQWTRLEDLRRVRDATQGLIDNLLGGIEEYRQTKDRDVLLFVLGCCEALGVRTPVLFAEGFMPSLMKRPMLR